MDAYRIAFHQEAASPGKNGPRNCGPELIVVSNSPSHGLAAFRTGLPKGDGLETGSHPMTH
jgi:hypothetical protein